MSANGSVALQAIAPVVAAYQQTTQTNLPQPQKAEALAYLEHFQKSVGKLPLAPILLISI